MDAREFKTRHDGAREFEEYFEGRKFRLRVPSQNEGRQAFRQMAARGEAPDVEGFAFYLLPDAIIGWENVPARWVIPDADPGELIEWSPVAAKILVAEHLNLAAALALPLFDRWMKRRNEMEEARKNSPSASLGT